MSDRQKRYEQTEKGRAARRRAARKYQERTGYEAQLRYNDTDAGREARERYAQTDAGKEARREAQRRYRARLKAQRQDGEK